MMRIDRGWSARTVVRLGMSLVAACLALAACGDGNDGGGNGARARASGAAALEVAAPSLPCDIYAAGNTPCVAAYSTTRALFASYKGPLYQVQRGSDGRKLKLAPAAAGGVVDAAPQAAFCAGTTCTITLLYDQSPSGNDLPVSVGTSCAGCSRGIPGPGPDGADIGAPAMALPVTIGGRPAYGVLFDAQGTGYRIQNARNVPTGAKPEGIYMVTSSNLTSDGCCFDFGSGETDNSDDGDATMNAIYYGNDCWTKNCTGSGPWVGGDLENGMYFSDTGANPPGIAAEKGAFVTAWEKNDGRTNFTLRYGNGQQGGLASSYSGPLPPGYRPMKVQRSIELGTGGDNSLWGKGEFFEGAVTQGYPSDATEDAVQASIVAAGYGGNTTFVPTTMSVVSLKAHANGRYVHAASSSTALVANAGSIGAAETFDLVTNPDGSVSLRAHGDGEYVTAGNAGSTALIANAAAAGPWQTFDLIANADGSISLRAHANDLYVTAEDAGASPLIANRGTIGAWEEFDLVRDTEAVSLHAHADDEYVTAPNAGASALIASSTRIGAAETFDLVSNADGSVCLRAHANGQYVAADAAGASALVADSAVAGPWEMFDLVANADGSVSLRARANGRYVTAENAGASPLIANRDAVGPWEEFDLVR